MTNKDLMLWGVDNSLQKARAERAAKRQAALNPPQQQPQEETGVVENLWNGLKNIVKAGVAADNVTTEAGANILDAIGDQLKDGAVPNSFIGDVFKYGAKYYRDKAKRRDELVGGTENVTPANYNDWSSAIPNAVAGTVANMASGAGSFIHADESANKLNSIAQALTPQSQPEVGLNADYMFNPAGALYDLESGLTSTAMLAPLMFLAPEFGAATLASKIGGDALVRALLGTGSSAARRYLAKSTAQSLPDILRYAPTAGIGEGIIEGGNVRRQNLAQGLSDDEATRNSIKAALLNAGYLTGSNLIEGGLFFAPLKATGALGKAGQIAGRSLLGGLNQSVEEAVQQVIENAYTGRPLTENTWSSFSHGILPGIALGGLGAGRQALKRDENEENYRRGADNNYSVKDYGNIYSVRKKLEDAKDAQSQVNVDNYQNEDSLVGWAKDISGSQNDSTINKVIATAKKYGLDPRLALAVGTAESNLNQNEISEAGAIGVMQLMPETAEGLGVNPYDEDENIEGGVKYLKQMLDMFNGDTRLATAAYNAGHGAVQKYGGIPPYGETENYVERIHGYLGSQPEYSSQNSQSENIYSGENGQAEGKYWNRQTDNVSIEGLQPQGLNALDMLGKWFYEKTGKPLILTSGVDGTSHVAGEHSHYDGWKFDVNDWDGNSDGHLVTADGSKGTLTDEFIAYGRSLGLGMNWEGDHIDVALDGTQWDGNGENAGGFNPEKLNSMRQASPAPSTSRTLSISSPTETTENENYADEAEEEFKPIKFSDDDETQNLFDEFASNQAGKSQGKDTEKFNFFNSFFTDQDDFMPQFQNTQENREKILENYGDEFRDFLASKGYFEESLGKPEQKVKSQLQQPQEQPKPQQGKVEFPEITNKVPSKLSRIEKIRQIREWAIQNKNAKLAAESKTIENSGDVQAQEKFVRDNPLPKEFIQRWEKENAEEPEVSEETSTVETPAQEKSTAETKKSKVEIPAKLLEIARAKVDMDNSNARIRQGEALLKIAKLNKFKVDKTLERTAKQGFSKAVPQLKALLEEQGFLNSGEEIQETAADRHKKLRSEYQSKQKELDEAYRAVQEIPADTIDVMGRRKAFKNFNRLLNERNATREKFWESTRQVNEEWRQNRNAPKSDYRKAEWDYQNEIAELKEETEKARQKVEKLFKLGDFDARKKALKEYQSLQQQLDSKIAERDKFMVSDDHEQDLITEYEFAPDKRKKEILKELIESGQRREQSSKEYPNFTPTPRHSKGRTPSVKTPEEILKRGINYDEQSDQFAETPAQPKIEGQPQQEVSQPAKPVQQQNPDFENVQQQTKQILENIKAKESKPTKAETSPTSKKTYHFDGTQAEQQEITPAENISETQEISQTPTQETSTAPTEKVSEVEETPTQEKSGEKSKRVIKATKEKADKYLQDFSDGKVSAAKTNEKLEKLANRTDENQKLTDAEKAEVRDYAEKLKSDLVDYMHGEKNLEVSETEKSTEETPQEKSESVPKKSESKKTELQSNENEQVKKIKDEYQKWSKKFKKLDKKYYYVWETPKDPKELQGYQEYQFAEQMKDNIEYIMRNANYRIISLSQAIDLINALKSANNKVAVANVIKKINVDFKPPFTTNENSEVYNLGIDEEYKEFIQKIKKAPVGTTVKVKHSTMGCENEYKMTYRSMEIGGHWEFKGYTTDINGQRDESKARAFDNYFTELIPRPWPYNIAGYTISGYFGKIIYQENQAETEKSAEETPQEKSQSEQDNKPKSRFSSRFKEKSNEGAEDSNKKSKSRKLTRKEISEKLLDFIKKQTNVDLQPHRDSEYEKAGTLLVYWKGLNRGQQRQIEMLSLAYGGMFRIEDMGGLGKILKPTEKAISEWNEEEKSKSTPKKSAVKKNSEGQSKSKTTEFENNDPAMIKAVLNAPVGTKIELQTVGFGSSGKSYYEITERGGGRKMLTALDEDGKRTNRQSLVLNRENVKKFLGGRKLGKDSEMLNTGTVRLTYPENISEESFEETKTVEENSEDNAPKKSDEKKLNDDFTLSEDIDSQDRKFFRAVLNTGDNSSIGKVGRGISRDSINKLSDLAEKHNGKANKILGDSGYSGEFRFKKAEDREAFLQDEDVDDVLYHETTRQAKEQAKEQAKKLAEEQELQQKKNEYRDLVEKGLRGEKLTGDEIKNIRENNNLLEIDENLREGLHQKFPELKTFIDKLFNANEKDIDFNAKTTLSDLVATNKNSDQIYPYAADKLRDLWWAEHSNNKRRTLQTQAAKDKYSKSREFFEQFAVKEITPRELYEKTLKLFYNRKEKFDVEGEVDTTITDDMIVADKDLTSQQKTFTEIGNKMGLPIKFFKGAPSFRGVLRKGVSYINVNNKNFEQTFYHEAAHYLSNFNPKLFDEILKAVPITKEQLQAIREKSPLYENLNERQLKEEILADNFMDLSKRAGFLREVGKQNKTLAEKIVSWLKSLMDKFTGFFSNPKGGLTRTQREAMQGAFNEVVRSMVDKNGNKIFRVSNVTGEVQKATGEKLPEVDLQERRKKFENADDVYSFAGAKAKTADKDSLEQAQIMEKQGKTYNSIFKKTGWLKGKDGKWRFEIPDNLDKIDFSPLKGNGMATLGEIYDNPKLYEAYPELENLKITSTTFNAYSPKLRTIRLDIRKQSGLNEVDNPRRTLIHEIQHAIQSIEDFARGGSPESVDYLLQDSLEDIKTELYKLDPYGDYVNEVNLAYEDATTKKELKDLLERRAVQNGTHLSESERKKIVNLIDRKRAIEKALRNKKLSAEEKYSLLGGEQEANTAMGRANYAGRDSIWESFAKQTPKIHSDKALIVFSGKSFSMASMSNSPDRYSIDPSDNSNEGWRTRFANWIMGRPVERLNREITKMLGKAADLKILYRHFSGDAKVVLDELHGVLRAKNAYDWDNLLPVVGKIFAEKLNLQPSEEMNNFIADWLLTGALNNTSTERTQFERAMRENPALAESLMEIQEKFRAYADMDALEQYKAHIGGDSEGLIRKIIRAKQEGTLIDQFTEDFVDDLNPLKKIDERFEKLFGMKLAENETIYNMARMYKGASGIVRNLIRAKTDAEVKAAIDSLKKIYPNVNFEKFVPLQKIISNIGGEKYVEDLEAYCLACLDKEMYEKNRELEEKARAKGKTLEEKDKYKPVKSEEKADEVIRRHKDRFGQAQQDLVNYSNTILEISHDSGLISNKQYEHMKKNWKNYIPTHRIFDEAEKIDLADSMKHKRGSDRDIVHPIRVIIRNTAFFVDQAEKNKVKQELAAKVRLGAFGDLVSEEEFRNGNEPTITFKENGKTKHLAVTSEIKRAVDSLSGDRTQAAYVFKVIHAASRIVSNLYTAASPDFAVGNIFRDAQESYLYNDKARALSLSNNPIANLIRAFKFLYNSFKKTPEYTATFYEWQAMGGSQSSFVSFDMDSTKDLVDDVARTRAEKWISQPFTQILRSLQEFSERLETVNRLAVYEQTKGILAKQNADGKVTESDMKRAAFASRNATIDFARGGRSMREINKYFRFSNVAVQDLNKSWELLKTLDPRNLKTKEGRQKAFDTAIKIGFLMLTTMALFAKNHDEDWYKHGTQQWQKDTSWILGEGLKIPKSYSFVGKMTSTLTEEFLKKFVDDEPLKARRLLSPLGEALPSIMPTLLTPIVEAVSNYSFFYGGNLVPQKELRLPAYKQYNEKTSGFAKEIGGSAPAKFLSEILFGNSEGFSPRKIDHVINGYLGFPGRLIFGQYTWTLDEAPMAKRFLFDPYKNPQIVQDYYNKRSEQEKLFNDYKQNRREGKNEKPDGYDEKLYKRIKSAEGVMKKISEKERKLIANQKIPADELKKQLQILEEKRVALCKKALGRK